MLFGTKPNMSKARGFEAKVFVRMKTKSKLEERAKAACWIGISEETKGRHIVYWPERHSVGIEHDVRFVDGTVFVGEEEVVVTTTIPSRNSKENQKIDLENPNHNAPLPQPNSPVLPPPNQSTDVQNRVSDPHTVTDHTPKKASDTIAALENYINSMSTGRPQQERKPSAYVRQLLEHGNELPIRIRQYKSTITTSEMKRPSQGDQSSDSKSLNTGNGALANRYAMSAIPFETDGIVIPQTHDQALRSAQKEEWLEAEATETMDLIINKTLGLLIPQSELKTQPLPLCWVYDTKQDLSGNVTGYKAWIVVCGDKQEKFVNFEETFAPVMKATSWNILLAIAAQNDWHIQQSDFKSAYLNAELDEDIHVTQPPGYEIPGKEDHVYQLDKALYGLKQAGRLWFLAVSVRAT
jgi:hypothetical protein